MSSASNDSQQQQRSDGTSRKSWLIAVGAVLVIILSGLVVGLVFGGNADPLRTKAEAAADFSQGALTLNGDLLVRTLPRKYGRSVPAIVSAASVTLGADSLIGSAVQVKERRWDEDKNVLVIEANIPALDDLLPVRGADADSPSAVVFQFVPAVDSDEVELQMSRGGVAKTLGVITLAKDDGWRVINVNGTSVDDALRQLCPNSTDIMTLAAGTFDSGRGNAQSRSCFANERTCEGVFQQVIANGDIDSRDRVNSFQQLIELTVPAYLKKEPKCPTGGDYDVSNDEGSSGVVVTCSVHGHY